jgi:hypothetical protein
MQASKSYSCARNPQMTWTKAIGLLEVARKKGMKRNQIIEVAGYVGLMHK